MLSLIFIIGGTAASGTSYLSATLVQHPQIYLPQEMRPEPHFFYKSWEYKNHNMGCSFYDYGSNNLIDYEFVKKDILTVYSVGSTALLYAKMIYGIPSYIIDISKDDCHPPTYKKYKYVAETYNIPIVRI